MACDPIDPPLTDEQKAELKQLTGGIIRIQSNRFIKELMREKGITLGRNKSEFEANLLDAIDNSCISLDDVKAWLDDVEGWGNQYVYLYGVSDKLRSYLTPTKIRNAAKRNGWENKLNAHTELEFEDEPQLNSISFKDGVLRITWQEGTESWTPDDTRTYQKEEGLDLYEYRAHRQVQDRVITRFVVRLDLGLAAILVPHPIRGRERSVAKEEVERVVDALMSLAALDDEQLDLSVVARNMDQASFENADDDDPGTFIRPQKSRLSAGGSYVEFGAMSANKAYGAEGPVVAVRDSIKTAKEQEEFDADSGVFLFGPGRGIEKRVRAELHGAGDRIRFRAQMRADEVWTILAEIAKFRDGP